MKRVCPLSVVLFLVSLTSAYGWGDLCQDAQETPSMTKVQMEQFFNDSLKGNTYSGKGVVRDVRPYGGSENYVVVDCLNNVLVNVVTSSPSAKDLKVGDDVRFSGRCTHTFRRGYTNTRSGYQVFELQGGDVR